MTLAERLRRAARRAAVPTYQVDVVVNLVLEELANLADEWEEASSDYYYANRHTGPIEYASGFEDGWDHAGALIRGHHPAPAQRRFDG